MSSGCAKSRRTLAFGIILFPWLSNCEPFFSAEGVTLLVRDQKTPHDAELLAEITANVAEAGWSHRSVISMAATQDELKHNGLWSYKSWIFQLAKQMYQDKKRRVVGGQRWFIFLEPTTMVDATRLGEALQGFASRDGVYLGRAISDAEPSILHSYSQEPPYPLVHAGFAINGALVRRLADDLARRPLGQRPHHPQQIEPVFELAQWISDLGISLTDRPDLFCTERLANCATWITTRNRHRKSWGLQPANVVVVVKTVGKLHEARIPLVHEFWGASSEVEVLYLSNEGFTGVPGATVIDLSPEFGSMVDPAKESTKHGSGHCTKMEAILKYLARHRSGKRWYVVTDDDTLVNMQRLLEVLDSHDDSKSVYIGDRYGWNHGEDYQGTNYITTGGGMALSGPALATLVACKSCTCRTPDSPDDMTLGSWFAYLQISASHEEGFHQAEPENYHPELLRWSDPAVSFHRFGARLPGSASEVEKKTARQKNWQTWVEAYFGRGGRRKEL